jgi:DNA polymerase I-like protein with 3'-5' exonuclease and polymerase domains
MRSSISSRSTGDDRLFDAGIDGGPVAWLHDEIVIEVREDQAAQAAEILKQAMIDASQRLSLARLSMDSSSRRSARTGARRKAKSGEP